MKKYIWAVICFIVCHVLSAKAQYAGSYPMPDGSGTLRLGITGNGHILPRLTARKGKTGHCHDRKGNPENWFIEHFNVFLAYLPALRQTICTKVADFRKKMRIFV